MWKRKLASRKFWALIAGVATSVLAMTGAGEEITLKIVGLIGAVGSVMVYIAAEASVDANRASGVLTESEEDIINKM